MSRCENTEDILRKAARRCKLIRPGVLESRLGTYYFDDIMFSPELFIVSTLKALVEIAGMALLAQGLIGLLAGKARDNNFVYRLLKVVTAPVMKGVRFITPKFVPDAHIGLATFFLLFWMWVALIYAKSYVCTAQQLACVAS